MKKISIILVSLLFLVSCGIKDLQSGGNGKVSLKVGEKVASQIAANALAADASETTVSVRVFLTGDFVDEDTQYINLGGKVKSLTFAFDKIPDGSVVVANMEVSLGDKLLYEGKSDSVKISANETKTVTIKLKSADLDIPALKPTVEEDIFDEPEITIILGDEDYAVTFVDILGDIYLANKKLENYNYYSVCKGAPASESKITFTVSNWDDAYSICINDAALTIQEDNTLSLAEILKNIKAGTNTITIGKEGEDPVDSLVIEVETGIYDCSAPLVRFLYLSDTVTKEYLPGNYGRLMSTAETNDYYVGDGCPWTVVAPLCFQSDGSLYNDKVQVKASCVQNGDGTVYAKCYTRENVGAEINPQLYSFDYAETLEGYKGSLIFIEDKEKSYTFTFQVEVPEPYCQKDADGNPVKYETVIKIKVLLEQMDPLYDGYKVITENNELYYFKKAEQYYDFMRAVKFEFNFDAEPYLVSNDCIVSVLSESGLWYLEKDESENVWLKNYDYEIAEKINVICEYDDYFEMKYDSPQKVVYLLKNNSELYSYNVESYTDDSIIYKLKFADQGPVFSFDIYADNNYQIAAINNDTAYLATPEVSDEYDNKVLKLSAYKIDKNNQSFEFTGNVWNIETGFPKNAIFNLFDCQVRNDVFYFLIGQEELAAEYSCVISKSRGSLLQLDITNSNQSHNGFISEPKNCNSKTYVSGIYDGENNKYYYYYSSDYKYRLNSDPYGQDWDICLYKQVADGEYEKLTREYTVQKYSPEDAEDISGFFCPNYFVAIRPKKLIVSETGCFIYDDEMKGTYINRFVEVNLERFALTELCDYPINSGKPNLLEYYSAYELDEETYYWPSMCSDGVTVDHWEDFVIDREEMPASCNITFMIPNISF